MIEIKEEVYKADSRAQNIKQVTTAGNSHSIKSPSSHVYSSMLTTKADGTSLREINKKLRGDSYIGGTFSTQKF